MYESRRHPPLSRAKFARRLLRHAAMAFAVLAISLVFGMAGYERYENLAWRDAFLNSAMAPGRSALLESATPSQLCASADCGPTCTARWNASSARASSFVSR